MKNPSVLFHHNRRATALLAICLLAGMSLLTFHGINDRSGQALAATKIIYTCPMDPQIIQDTPGKCPICGMNLVKKEITVAETKKPSPPSAPKKTDASSEVKYQCPMHPTIVQDHPGDCPICGMKLVKMKGTSSSQQQGNASSERKIAFYRSPMDPKQTSPVPRKDEMGMDYLPVYTDEVSGEDTAVENRAEVTIDPSRQQLIGLRTAPAIRGDIHADWHTVGRVQVDQTKVRKINIKVAGYVDRIFVDFVGKTVRQGEPLFTFYSPDLLTAQREYLLALKASRSGGRDVTSDSLMVDVVKQKLQLWDVPEEQIDHLAETGEITKSLTFVSPVTGVVTAKSIVQGSSLNPGDTPYEITDLSSVWVVADAYQSDAARAKIGMKTNVSLEALPDRVFPGTVAFVDPVIDPQSRTFKVRIDIENTNGEFKPDMFADVVLLTSARESLTIPADAIIPTGNGSMVFVALGNGKFQPRAVKVGEKSGDRIEITDGVREGELVVKRANFLVDSESSLRAALSAVGGK